MPCRPSSLYSGRFHPSAHGECLDMTGCHWQLQVCSPSPSTTTISGHYNYLRKCHSHLLTVGLPFVNNESRETEVIGRKKKFPYQSHCFKGDCVVGERCQSSATVAWQCVCVSSVPSSAGLAKFGHWESSKLKGRTHTSLLIKIRIQVCGPFGEIFHYASYLKRVKKKQSQLFIGFGDSSFNMSALSTATEESPFCLFI